MDLRIAITNKTVQDILGKVSKVDKRILVQEAILHFNDEILKGNTRSIVYDPHEVAEKDTNEQGNIQQEEQPKIDENTEIQEDISKESSIFDSISWDLKIGGEDDGHQNDY